MLTAVGWLGSICLSLCGIPQAYQCWKTKKADDISGLFIGLWLAGELLTLVYVLLDAYSLPLTVNYIFNIILISIIGYYKWRRV